MTFQFSEWVHWDHRTTLLQRDRPGVYALAHFDQAPSRVVDPTDERVVLIGETHSQTLAQRWRQFDYAATRGQYGHAGGYTFWRLYGNGADSPIPGWLFVAACATPEGTADPKSWTMSVKNDLLTQYEERHGVLPACNTRGASKATTAQPTEPTESLTVAPSADETTPEIVFSLWTPWKDRLRVPGMDSAGVYALAHFGDTPPQSPDLLDERIFYIGETCDNSLRGRLNQFQRSAFAGKDGHSGGWVYYRRYGNSGDGLHVSIFPVSKLVEPKRSAFIRFVERDLLWRYVQRWGRRPLCNSK